MIKDKKMWEEFEKKLSASTPPDYKKNLQIFNDLYEEAVLLKAIPAKDPLDNIEVAIRISKVLNNLG